jgi:hypothetical protein
LSQQPIAHVAALHDPPPELLLDADPLLLPLPELLPDPELLPPPELLPDPELLPLPELLSNPELLPLPEELPLELLDAPASPDVWVWPPQATAAATAKAGSNFRMNGSLPASITRSQQ